jgi:hypothetical protein
VCVLRERSRPSGRRVNRAVGDERGVVVCRKRREGGRTPVRTCGEECEWRIGEIHSRPHQPHNPPATLRSRVAPAYFLLDVACPPRSWPQPGYAVGRRCLRVDRAWRLGQDENTAGRHHSKTTRLRHPFLSSLARCCRLVLLRTQTSSLAHTVAPGAQHKSRMQSPALGSSAATAAADATCLRDVTLCARVMHLGARDLRRKTCM